MIPIRDDNPRTEFPIVNIVIIAANILIHLYTFSIPAHNIERFYQMYGAIPAELIRLQGVHTLFTSMFLHGGLLHLAGNVLYLYIFGDNVENAMGHTRYFFFYLICGLGAAISHIVIEPASAVPMIGASGAISGILGAYALTYPHARVLVVVPIFIILYSFRIPAIVVLGIWFIMQLGSGILSLGAGATAGIAWFAHIGGFLIGVLLVGSFRKYVPHSYDDDF